MRISNVFNAMKVRTKRMARTAMSAVASITLLAAALLAQAANVYGPPSLQPALPRNGWLWNYERVGHRELCAYRVGRFRQKSTPHGCDAFLVIARIMTTAVRRSTLTM